MPNIFPLDCGRAWKQREKSGDLNGADVRFSELPPVTAIYGWSEKPAAPATSSSSRKRVVEPNLVVGPQRLVFRPTVTVMRPLVAINQHFSN